MTFEAAMKAFEATEQAAKAVATHVAELQDRWLEGYKQGRKDLVEALVSTGHDITNAVGVVVTETVATMFDAVEALELFRAMESMDE